MYVSEWKFKGLFLTDKWRDCAFILCKFLSGADI